MKVQAIALLCLFLALLIFSITTAASANNPEKQSGVSKPVVKSLQVRVH